MTYSTDSLERPTRNLAIAAFVSVVIHGLLAYLLSGAFTGRAPVKPEAPANDTPLILTLSTFENASHDEMDLEVISEVPQKDTPVQQSQSSPEPSRSAERKSETDTVVISKDQGIQDSEVPEDKSLETLATLSMDLESAYRKAWEPVKIFEFKANIDAESKGQGFPGSGNLEGKSLTTCFTPLLELEDFYCIEREFGSMSQSEIMDFKIKPRMLYVNKYLAEARALHPDCKTTYSGAGLFAILPLIKDAITGNGCKWWPVVKEVDYRP